MYSFFITVDYVDAECNPNIFKITVPDCYRMDDIKASLNEIENNYSTDDYVFDYIETAHAILDELCKTFPGTTYTVVTTALTIKIMGI